MPSETLSGDVFSRDAAGKWRLVLTASGVSVVDGFKVPHGWREQVREQPKFGRLQGYASKLYFNGEDIHPFVHYGGEA